MIKVSKEFLPSMAIGNNLIQVKCKFIWFYESLAIGFQSEKFTLHIGDGFEFLKNNVNQFDVIINDLTEPESLNI